VDAIKDKAELPALFAWLNRIAVLAPLDISVHQDNKDSTKYVLTLVSPALRCQIVITT
jgi:predicted metalloendopeptidase